MASVLNKGKQKPDTRKIEWTEDHEVKLRSLKEKLGCDFKDCPLSSRYESSKDEFIKSFHGKTTSEIIEILVGATAGTDNQKDVARHLISTHSNDLSRHEILHKLKAIVAVKYAIGELDIDEMKQYLIELDALHETNFQYVVILFIQCLRKR